MRGPAAGGYVGGARASGGAECGESSFDLAGGLVVLEGVVDLAAGQPARVLAQGGVDLFGEWIAGRAL